MKQFWKGEKTFDFHHTPKPVKGRKVSLSRTGISQPDLSQTKYLEKDDSMARFKKEDLEMIELRKKYIRLVTTVDEERKRFRRSLERKEHEIQFLKTEVVKVRDEHTVMENEFKNVVDLKQEIRRLKSEILEKNEYIRNQDKSNLQPIIYEYKRTILGNEKKFRAILNENEERIALLQKSLDERKEEVERLESRSLEVLSGKNQILEEKSRLMIEMETRNEEFNAKEKKYKQEIRALKKRMDEEVKSVKESFTRSYSQKEKEISKRTKSLEKINKRLISEEKIYRYQYSKDLKEKAKMIEVLHQKIKNPKELQELNVDLLECLEEMEEMRKLVQNRLSDEDEAEEERAQLLKDPSKNVAMLKKEIQVLKSIVLEAYAKGYSEKECKIQ